MNKYKRDEMFIEWTRTFVLHLHFNLHVHIHLKSWVDQDVCIAFTLQSACTCTLETLSSSGCLQLHSPYNLHVHIHVYLKPWVDQDVCIALTLQSTFTWMLETLSSSGCLYCIYLTTCMYIYMYTWNLE